MKYKPRKNMLSAIDKLAIKAMRSAVRKLMIERKKNGVPMSIWKDGKVITIPASKIVIK